MRKSLKHKTDEELYGLLSDSKRIARMAFDELYERYSSNVYTYCAKIIQNEETAQDIFQDTFVKFLESANKNKVMTNVAGYLIKIARNLCLNEKIRKHNDTVPLEDYQYPVNDKSYEKKEMDQIVRDSIDKLPEDYKEALILKEFMDLTYKEIAEVLGTNLSSVRIRIFRAKEKLRKIMKPYIEDLKNIN